VELIEYLTGVRAIRQIRDGAQVLAVSQPPQLRVGSRTVIQFVMWAG
jgi:hypothetical protein